MCDIPWFTNSSYTMALLSGTQPLEWDSAAVAVQFHLFGNLMMGQSVDTNPDMASLVYEADMDGARFMMMQPSSMRSIGFR